MPLLNQLQNSRLASLKIADCTWHHAAGVYEVRSPHSLFQASGYLKYALNADGGVYYRGQTAIHAGMQASLYRGIRSQRGKTSRETAFQQYAHAARQNRAFIPHTPAYSREALLQHYGIRSKWLDLVDNVWVALWFGCYEASLIGQHGKYLHYKPRTQADRVIGPPEYAYIILFQLGAESPDQSRPGIRTTNRAELIDLRAASPSVYLRPHAQHGLLFRRTSYPGFGSTDLSDFVVGAIRVELKMALEWLGAGSLTNVHHLFPPPHFDFGYGRLLKQAPSANARVGSVFHVGA